ncbi:MAG: IS3 family transposase [Victivallales bacterium]
MNSSANQALLERIRQLKAEHPYWSYRRIWAYLKYHEKLPVNQNRIHRLMKQNNLLVPKNLKLKAPRKTVTHKPRTIEPNRYWGIDMTKVMIPNFGWIYLHVVIDWGTKKLLSAHVSLTSKSADRITALNEAVNLQFPDGISEGPLYSGTGQHSWMSTYFNSFLQSLFRAWHSSNIRQLQQSQRECRHRTGDPNNQGEFSLDKRI